MGPSSGGTGGDTTLSTPVCADSDPAQVVAPQRIDLLTSTQLMNMIRLVGDGAVKRVVDGDFFPVLSDSVARFPPVRTEQYREIIDANALSPFVNTANQVGEYVRLNFAAVTGCASATDSCATTYLNNLAAKAYRRALKPDEQTRFSELYNNLKSQSVRGYQVTLSVEQATGSAVSALFLSPQLLWRWELGGQQSSSPAGVYLTDSELATNLSFFLSDQPPDAMMMADAAAGTLRANIGSHVDRILTTSQASRDWFTKLMGMYFFLNQLPSVQVDPAKFPIVAGGAVFADLEMESRLFLNDVMWKGKVMDLITSRKAFLNENLASMVYNVPVPAGATPTNFVETTLDPATRSGMLTSAAFITTRARVDGVGVVPRGLGVKALFLCLTTPPPPESINMEGGPVKEQAKMLELMTAQEQVQSRREVAVCATCHPSFDPYGLVLDWYDVIGRYRTTDHLDKPIDGTTALPAMLGGQTVKSAVELADVLSKNDQFVNCMAKTWLQYALLDLAVELPAPKEGVKGCAAAGIANQVRKSSTQSFTDLTRAVATSPAFVLRKQVQ